MKYLLALSLLVAVALLGCEKPSVPVDYTEITFRAVSKCNFLSCHTESDVRRMFGFVLTDDGMIYLVEGIDDFIKIETGRIYKATRYSVNSGWDMTKHGVRYGIFAITKID